MDRREAGGSRQKTKRTVKQERQEKQEGRHMQEEAIELELLAPVPVPVVPMGDEESNSNTQRETAEQEHQQSQQGDTKDDDDDDDGDDDEEEEAEEEEEEGDVISRANAVSPFVSPPSPATARGVSEAARGDGSDENAKGCASLHGMDDFSDLGLDAGVCERAVMQERGVPACVCASQAFAFPCSSPVRPRLFFLSFFSCVCVCLAAATLAALFQGPGDDDLLQREEGGQHD